MEGELRLSKGAESLRLSREGSSLGLCLSCLSSCLCMEMFTSLHNVVSSRESCGELFILETI